MQCTTVNYQQLCEPGPWPVCVCVCVFALSALPSKHLFPKNHDRQAEALTINKREQNTKKWKEKKISKRKYTEQKVGSSHVSPYLDLYRVVLYWSAKPIKKKMYWSLINSVQTLGSVLGSWVDWMNFWTHISSCLTDWHTKFVFIYFVYVERYTYINTLVCSRRTTSLSPACITSSKFWWVVQPTSVDKCMTFYFWTILAYNCCFAVVSYIVFSLVIWLELLMSLLTFDKLYIFLLPFPVWQQAAQVPLVLKICRHIFGT